MKNTKRIFSVLLVMLMLLSSAPLSRFIGLKASAASYEGTCGESVYWSFDSKTGALEITGSGEMEDYYYDDDYYAPWSSYIGSIKTVTIENNITSIGDYAFEDCGNLKSVTIPNSVTSIGYEAFCGCDSLESITIPDSVTSIGGGAFDDTKYYNNEDNWTDEVLYIGKYLIKAQDSFSGDYNVSEGTKLIADNAFFDCESLESITIPNSVTSIGNLAFYDCYSLESITVDEDNDYYSSDSYGVLYNKDKTTLIQYPIGNTRTSFDIPDSVTSIGYRAFDECYSLESIEIGSSVTSIGEGAFWSCESLESITIPNSVTSIGGGAFNLCISLESITILNPKCEIYDSEYTFPEETVIHGYSGSMAQKYAENYNRTFVSIDYINVNGQCGENAYWSFDGETGKLEITGSGKMYDYNNGEFVAPWYNYTDSIKTVTIESGITSIGDYAFYYYENLESITIPDSVTSIGEGAFGSCDSLESVTIPDSVTNIGYEAFIYCYSLESITVDDKNDYYSSDTYGVLYNKDKTTLIQYPIGNTRISFDIPNSVTSIGGGAFEGCSSLESIKIPDSVTSIGDYAFYYCDRLKSVTIPDSVTSIGRYAFFWCNSLESVEIGSGVTSIVGSVFGGCHSLESVTIPDSVTSIGDWAFYDCSSLESVGIGSGVTSIGESAFYDCWSLESVEIGSGVTSIGERAFLDCDSLESVTILNPECEIYNSSDTLPYGTVIHGYSNSTAQKYAEKYGRRFVVIDSGVEHTHTPDAGTVTKAATCTEPGTRTFKCTVCGEITKTETIPAAGHKSVVVKGKAATCIETGLTDGSKCSVCGTILKAQTTVAKKEHTYENVTTKATLTKNGKIVPTCSVCKATKTAATVYYPKTIKLSATSATYTGKAIKPKVTVTDSKGKTVSSSNYTVSYKNNTKVGTATVTVTFKGNYSGTKKLTFKIVPGQVKNLKASKVTTTAVKLAWSKVTGAKYYKIEQSTDGKKWKTVKTTDKTTYTVTKLKTGAKYRFRVTALDSTKKIAGKVSSVLKTGTKTAAPKVTLKSTKSKTATASWKKVTGASKYIVYKSTNNKKWTKVGSTTKLSYKLSKLSGGKKIYVKVIAVNAYKQNSAYSKVASVTVKK